MAGPEAEASSFTLSYPEAEIAVVEEEVSESGEKTGRKRTRKPKHKKPGLRKNSPRLSISNLLVCCKKKCLQLFSSSHLTQVRETFESMYYEEQNIYLNGILRREETKKTSGHTRKQNPATSSTGKRLGRPPAEESRFSFKYIIRNERGIDIRVCQKAFCYLHGFGPKRLLILRKGIEDCGTLESDRRGKHGKQYSVGENIKNLIRDHIRSFPARQSHYSRHDNAGRVYLSPELSIAKLHRLFLEKHDPEQLEQENVARKVAHKPVEVLRKPLVVEHMYHDIFVKEFNIGFGYPRTDTCDTCDSLKLRIEQASSTESEKEKLQKEHEEHLSLAESGYSAFKRDQQLCKSSWERLQTKT